MNAIFIARYPGHQIGNVIKAFTDPNLPPRHDSVQELGSITFMVGEGFRTVFLMSMPDADMAAVLEAQTKRTGYMTARVEGLSIEIHFGYDSAAGIPLMMGVLPG